MIAYLEGKVVHRDQDRIVLLCGSVGYEIAVTNELYLQARENTNLTLWIQEILREDRLELYGFSRRIERDLFLLLLKVQQVGPKLAMNLLNAYPPEKFAEIVLSENQKLLSQVSGIGPKTAQRIIVELKDRLKSLPIPRDSALSPVLRDAFDALIVLGYAPRDAAWRLEKIAKRLPPSITVEEIVRSVLAGEGEVEGA